jgi:LAS superfamily LD-carboxypeptidase LdcB
MTVTTTGDAMGREQLPADAARRLAALQAAAGTGEKASGGYENALRAFNAAGWSWRQLGDALDLTHEAIRKRAGRPPVDGAAIQDPAAQAPAARGHPGPGPPGQDHQRPGRPARQSDRTGQR